MSACDKVATFIQAGEDEFRVNEMIQDAVVRNLEIIGEASKNISEEVRTQAGDQPWRKIAGMRDKLVHHYFGVDLDLVWETASNILPSLRIRIAELLEIIGTDGSEDRFES